MCARSIRRLPWATSGLAGLCALAALLPPELLQYDRARVEAGEVWRLLTGQTVHWTVRMALLDLGMLLGIGAWLEARGDRRRMVLAWVLGGALTTLAVAVFSSGLSLYRGSSGLASALFVLGALRIAEESGLRPLALAAVALFLGKAAVEALTGQTLFAGPLPEGVQVVPLVHLLGGIGGVGGLLAPHLEKARVNAVVFREV